MPTPDPHATGSRAAELEAALSVYADVWQRIENERGEYVRANERHRLAMEAAVAIVFRMAYERAIANYAVEGRT